jgi:TatD DNase family protein
MIEYIDIHTHRAAMQENVLSVVNLLQPAVALPAGYFSTGWHPWHIENVSLNEIESSMRAIGTHENLIAIGECGIDRIIKTPVEKQADVFKLHLQLAKQYDKPLIIHCVKAYSDLIQILKKENFKGKIVLHGFSGNSQIADKFMKFNTWFSFGKLLFNSTAKRPEVLITIPGERLFLETDDANYSIAEIYLRASEIMNIPVSKLCERIKMNFNELVGYGLVEQDPVVTWRRED